MKLIRTTPPNKHIAFRLSQELLTTIDSLCDELDLTRSQVIRRCLNERIGCATLSSDQRRNLDKTVRQLELIVRLTKHEALLPGSRASVQSEIRRASVQRGLSELLHLSPMQSRMIAMAMTDCDQYLQEILLWRLEHLNRSHAASTQIQSFLKLIPLVHKPLPHASEQRLSQLPKLRECICQARERAVQDKTRVLEHIKKGKTGRRASQLQAGGHLQSTFERLADEAFSERSEELKEAIKLAVANRDPEKERERIIREYGKKTRFDLSGDRWIKFSLLDQKLWRYAIFDNGVRLFRLPIQYFHKRGWKSTWLAAKYGVIPIGGKSVFPIDWTEIDILDAIIAVLEDPNAFVLRLDSTKDSFYLRSLVKNVYVEVGVQGGNVNTAFPSWRQDRPDSIGSAYREWYNDESRLRDGLDYGSFRNDCDFLTKIQFPNEFIAGYFGERPLGITKAEWEKLEPWLNPARVAEVADPEEAQNLQFTIFDYIYRSRMVQELEGVIGPVH